MNSKRTDQLIKFLKEIEQFKLIERQTYLSSFRRENDAEHSWHVALFVILFEKDFPGLDVAKMLKMALIHDLVEIYAGDTFSFDKEGRKNKKEREAKAAKKLFSQLPLDLKSDFVDLFNDYENHRSLEAKIVQSFDKMQPILQGIMSQGKMWQVRGITHRHIDDYKKKYLHNDKKMVAIYRKLIAECKRKKLFGKEPNER